MGTWIGVAVSALGVLIALYEWRQRSKIESVMQDALSRLGGDLRVVYSNAHWADIHCRNIRKSLLEPNANLTAITQEAVDAARDSTACARQLALVHSRIRGIQKSLFNDTSQVLPEIVLKMCTMQLARSARLSRRGTPNRLLMFSAALPTS